MQIRYISLLLLVCFCALFSSSLLAVKMYKWVDENGETHFSQTPPVTGEDQVNPDAVSVKRIKVPGLAPRKSQGEVYCGELKLPQERKRYPFTEAQLNKKIDNWSKSKARASKSLKLYLAPKKTNKYRSSRYRKSTTYNEKLSQLQKPVRQYQCAMDWASAKIDDIRNGRGDRQSAIKKAQRDLSAARSQQQERCGEEPPEYNTYGKGRDRYLSWERCIRRNNAVVRKMERKLKDVEKL